MLVRGEGFSKINITPQNFISLAIQDGVLGRCLVALDTANVQELIIIYSTLPEEHPVRIKAGDLLEEFGIIKQYKIPDSTLKHRY